MSGAESRAALEDWAVELLDEAEELALGEHLEGCAPCTAHWGALSGAYVELTAMVHEDEAKDAIEETQAAALRTQVLDGVLAVVQEGPEATGDDEDKDEAKGKALSTPPAAPTPDAQALGIKVKQSCCYCHAPTSREEVTFCATCLAPHHRECFREHGRCSTIACEETRTVRPVAPDLGEDAAPVLTVKRGGFRAGYALVLGVALMGGLAALNVAKPEPVAMAPSPFEQKVDALELKASALLGDLRHAANEGDRLAASVAFGKIETLCKATVAEDVNLRGVAYRFLGEAESLRAQVMPGNKLFNIDAEGADLSSVLNTISGYAGRRIMASPEIDPLITVTLVQVSWQDALEVVSEVAGCRVEERPGGALLLTQPPRVTLQFTDANVRTVLQMLAAYSKRNIVISPDVRGSVTLDLKDARWDEALLGITNTVGDFMVLLKGDDILQIVARSSTDSLVVTSYGEPWTPEKYNRFVAEQALQVNRWRPAADSRIPERPVEGDETAQRVSLEFTDADVHEVVSALSKQAEVSLGVDSAIRESISVSLKNVRWQHALRVVASEAKCRVQERSESGRLLALVRIPKVSIEIQNANVRAVIQSLSVESQQNVLISPDLRGAISLRLANADWDAAVTAVVEGVGSYSVARIGDQLMARSNSSAEYSQGEPLELGKYWSLLPDDSVKVRRMSDSATLAEHCAAITSWTGCPIRIEGQAPTHTAQVSSYTPWREAVRAVQSVFKCTVQETPDGLVFRAAEPNLLRAFYANQRTWLLLLARLAKRDIVIPPDLRGTATLELQNVSYEGALDTAVRTWGHRSRDVNGVSVLGAGPRVNSTVPTGRTLTFTLGGHSYSVGISGLTISPSEQFVIVEDRVYQVGDRVIDEETGEEHEGPLVIAEITTHGAVLVSGGESLALIVARGPDGQFRTVSEDVYNLSNRPAVLGARFVDDDSSASNDALSGQLESIGRPAIKALVRLVRNPDFQGRGNAAVTLATIVSGLKPGPQRAEAAAAIRGMRVTPQDRATVKLKARALKLIKELP